MPVPEHKVEIPVYATHHLTGLANKRIEHLNNLIEKLRPNQLSRRLRYTREREDLAMAVSIMEAAQKAQVVRIKEYLDKNKINTEQACNDS